MKRVKLSPYIKGISATVDDEDFESISRYKWKYSLGYAVRNSWDPKNKRYKNLYMHRVIAKTPEGLFTDHIDRNKLNNRKNNLRVVNKSLNSVNRDKRPDNTTGYVGVYKHYPKEHQERGWRPSWSAQICRDGVTDVLGYYKTPKEAHEARLKKLREYDY